jgi:alcohol dehydrogenase (cytochrome c)
MRIVAVAAVALLALAGRADAGNWTQPNGGPSGTRATSATAISTTTVRSLRVRWRFRISPGSSFGSFASTPLIAGGTVYAQTLDSSVYALDARTGKVRWRWLAKARNDGPNGLAATTTTIFGTTDTSVFALDRRTGRRLWARFLVRPGEPFVDIAPLAGDGLVFASTVGYPPDGRGALYALDQRTGRVRWRFQTVKEPWPHPAAGGGGAWYAPSLAPDGRLYVGIGNPDPWGGTRAHPNGSIFGGRALYTDALLALNARSGKLLWFDQVTRRDIRDYDLEASPIVIGDRVFGAGKAGRVVGWNRLTGRRVWATAVGTHLHDLGPLTAKPELVCPGLWGGVLTPMSYAHGRLFVPVVEKCARESARSSAALPDLRSADGVVTALSATTGRKLWTRRVGGAPTGCTTVAGDVVLAPTLDGRLLALDASDGRIVWRQRLSAGINGCPAVAGDLVVVGAGAPKRGRTAPEIVAYGLHS